MKGFRKILLVCFLLTSCAAAYTQDVIIQDSLKTPVKQRIDLSRPISADTGKKDFSPRKAAIRSAIIPGWGQIYNKKYWKLPLVYGALGVTGYIFFDNLKTYKELRFAYSARYKAMPRTDYTPDSTDYFKLDDIYKVVSIESIRQNRDQFRQYIDYSVLFFLFFWGLNVVDASVDAHLKGFDVSPDLSLKIKAGHSNMANTNGISLIFTIGSNRSK